MFARHLRLLAVFVGSHSICGLDTWKSWGTVCRLESSFAAYRTVARVAVWARFCSSSRWSGLESGQRHSEWFPGAPMSWHSHSQRTSASSYREAVCWPPPGGPCSWPSYLSSFSCSACSEICGTSGGFWWQSSKIERCRAICCLDYALQTCSLLPLTSHFCQTRSIVPVTKARPKSSWRGQRTAYPLSAWEPRSYSGGRSPLGWFDWWTLWTSDRSSPSTAQSCPLCLWLSSWSPPAASSSSSCRSLARDDRPKSRHTSVSYLPFSSLFCRQCIVASSTWWFWSSSSPQSSRPPST